MDAATLCLFASEEEQRRRDAVGGRSPASQSEASAKRRDTVSTEATPKRGGWGG